MYSQDEFVSVLLGNFMFNSCLMFSLIHGKCSWECDQFHRSLYIDQFININVTTYRALV